MPFTLKTRHWMVICCLLALVALGITGLVLTCEQDSVTPGKQKTGARRPQYVDLGPLQTARQLAASASGRDEQKLARQALKLADHQVDLAFAVALREAAQQHPEPTPETRELYDRAKKAEAVVKTDQDQIDQLKKQLAATPASRQDPIQQRINLAQAQFELDQDVLEDAQEDLIRSGADPQSRIQRQFSRYQASSQRDQEANAIQSNSAKTEASDSSTVIGQFGVWRELHGKATQLQAANQAALSTANALRQSHDQLEQQLQLHETTRQLLKQQASNQLQSDTGSADAA